MTLKLLIIRCRTILCCFRGLFVAKENPPLCKLFLLCQNGIFVEKIYNLWIFYPANPALRMYGDLSQDQGQDQDFLVIKDGEVKTLCLLHFELSWLHNAAPTKKLSLAKAGKFWVAQ